MNVTTFFRVIRLVNKNFAIVIKIDRACYHFSDLTLIANDKYAVIEIYNCELIHSREQYFFSVEVSKISDIFTLSAIKSAEQLVFIIQGNRFAVSHIEIHNEDYLFLVLIPNWDSITKIKLDRGNQ